MLIDELQLVNEIYAYDMPSIDENLFIILAVCNPGVEAERAENEILKILDELKTKPIAQDDVTKIKNLIKSKFVYAQGSASKAANLLGDYLARGSIEPLYKLQSASENLSAEILRDTAKKYFTPHNSTTIILRKEKSE